MVGLVGLYNNDPRYLGEDQLVKIFYSLIGLYLDKDYPFLGPVAEGFFGSKYANKTRDVIENYYPCERIAIGETHINQPMTEPCIILSNLKNNKLSVRIYWGKGKG